MNSRLPCTHDNSASSPRPWAGAGICAVTAVGRFVSEPGAWLERDGKREPLGRGFSHF